MSGGYCVGVSSWGILLRCCVGGMCIGILLCRGFSVTVMGNIVEILMGGGCYTVTVWR